MQNLAATALTTAAIFFAVVAVMLNSAALFYMGTALVAMIGACRLQAWLSVQGLSFRRTVPETALAGESVTIEVEVQGDRPIRRPLVTIFDHLPDRLPTETATPSTPVAPGAERPTRSQYRVVPRRRGRYRWSGLTVAGTDALGLITMRKSYPTDEAEMTVLPSPIPITLDLPSATGWGFGDAEAGRSSGAGLDPRGIREYSSGDPMRHVHWRSSAKRGRLLVKEFEGGSHGVAGFVLQRSAGSDLPVGDSSTLDWMCGNVAFLTESLLRRGMSVLLEGLSEGPAGPTDCQREILHLLAGLEANGKVSLADDCLRLAQSLPEGSMLICTASVADPDLPAVARELGHRGIRLVVLVYDAEAPVSRRGVARAAPGVANEPASSEGHVLALRSMGAHVSMVKPEAAA
jgi:uncharacterized protein (DUF58 family)